MQSSHAAYRADLEKALMIALALVALIAAVVVVVGRQGRLAETQASARREFLPPAKAPPPPTPSRPRKLGPSPLAEAPIGRSLPAPVRPAKPRRLGSEPGVGADSDLSKAEAFGPPAPRPRLLARPLAVDNATLSVGVSQIRLDGIEAMDAAETCGSGGTQWRCGAVARTALRGWLRARSASCVVPDDFERRSMSITTRCRVGQEDVALWLVANGWARPIDGRFGDAAESARTGGRGLWGPGAP